MQHKINVCFIDSAEQNNFSSILYASSLREVLSLLELQRGKDFINYLLSNEFKFVLLNKENPEEAISLSPEVILTDFSRYDTFVILKDIKGEDPATIGMAILTFLVDAGVVSSVALPMWAVTAIGMVAIGGIMVGASMLMQALSPTPEFSSDPAAVQNKSNLFNGAPIIRDQGGIVPLIFGNPYCGAVLISSGITSEEVAV